MKEIEKGLNEYYPIFTELKRVGFNNRISIEDAVEGMQQLERSVAFLRKKINQYWKAVQLFFVTSFSTTI